MSRCTLRSIFTILIYAGVGIFLFPYMVGRFSDIGLFILVGISLAVIAGILRCCCSEGDCTAESAAVGPTVTKPNRPTSSTPH